MTIDRLNAFLTGLFFISDQNYKIEKNATSFTNRVIYRNHFRDLYLYAMMTEKKNLSTIHLKYLLT